MKYIKAFFVRLYALMVKYPLAVAAAVLLIVGAVIMSVMGHDIQIGGLLGKLFSKNPVSPGVKVLPPPGRITSSGEVIQPGQSDDKGYVQIPVSMEIKDPGIFSDPDTITVIHPDKGEVTLPLPTGVKNTDVAEVIEIKPDVYQVKNSDKSNVDTDELLNILGDDP
jgi:hypothetical protein